MFLRLITISEKHMKKVNIEATYILPINFKPKLELEEKL